MDSLAPLLVALVLAALHLEARRLRFLSITPRSAWLSAAGGVSVAYVFLHLLPELQARQQAVAEGPGLAPWLERELYLLALLGLSAFYGLERMAARSRQAARLAGAADRTGIRAFALHMAAFAAYNFLIGYLLLRDERDNLLAYGLAMGLHFVANDHGLRAHHKDPYDRIGRWVLAAAVLGGAATGHATELPAGVPHALSAVLAGAIVMNVMKEELPDQRESRFSAFFAAAAAYGALLLFV